MKIVNVKFAVLLAVLTFALIGQAQASIAWSEPNGLTAFYDWENGQSTNGLFGNPIVSGNTLTFYPQSFRAESVNGNSNTVSDTLIFDLIAHTGNAITGIQISELGDYGIEGSGSVNVFGNISVENLSAAGSFNTNLITTPTMPMTSGYGNWQADGYIQLSNWTHLRITLYNELNTVTDANASAYIQKKLIGSPVSITIIPEPATLAFLAGGAAYLRRRKNYKKT